MRYNIKNCNFLKIDIMNSMNDLKTMINNQRMLDTITPEEKEMMIGKLLNMIYIINAETEITNND